MDEQLRKELSEIQSTLAGLREQVKAAFRRIDEQKGLTDSVHSLAISMERMLHEQKEVRKDVDAVFADVRDLKEEPGKKWKTVTMDLVKIVVAAVAGALLMKFGLQ